MKQSTLPTRVRFHPICYTSFNDLAVIFTPCTTFFNRKKKHILKSIRYREIASIEISIVRVPTIYLYLLGTSLHLQIVVHLKNKEKISLENEDISCLPALLNLLKRKKIPIVDYMDIQSILLTHETLESFYTHMDSNLTSPKEDQGKELRN